MTGGEIRTREKTISTEVLTYGQTNWRKVHFNSLIRKGIELSKWLCGYDSPLTRSLNIFGLGYLNNFTGC